MIMYRLILLFPRRPFQVIMKKWMDKFHQILFGGDQLTVARARGSQRIRKNSERGNERLEGLTPVCEDWHTKLCLLGVRRVIV